MPWPVHPTGFFGARGDSDTYRIERSLRFNSADSAYLNRTFGSGSRTTFTYSIWFKRTSLTDAYLFTAFFNSSNQTNAQFSSNALQIFSNIAGATSINLITTQLFRDPSSWYHLVVSVDTTQATASNRVLVYLNGSQITSFSTSTYPSQNANTNYGDSATVNYIGSYPSAGYFNGYIAETYFIDGQALTPSSFGETDAITGRWKAKAYSGTYGTNGFYLKFADNSGTTSTTLGKDSSGNGNNWTPNNFSVTAGAGNDSLVDSPTNYGTDTGIGGEVRGNYATLNPLSTLSTVTLANGNLDYSSTTASRTTIASIGISSGKYYWEVSTTAGTTETQVGVYGTSASTLFSLAANSTVYGIRFNADTGALDRTSDGSTWTSIATGLTSGPYFPYFNNNGITAKTVSVNFGQRPFAYAAPSGFRSLCTQNLPQPTIQKPSTAMDVVTYTGTGASQSISSLGFSPDLVWIKGRSGATDHAIYDTTRGVQKDLGSNLTTDETTQAQGVTAFGTNGFTIGTLAKLNTNTSTYVAWCWDESAMDGVDIVSYTGNGANRTISHNLGVAPKMIIVKARTTAGADQGWPVYHASLANTEYLLLNSTAAKATGTDYWNSTSPTASVFSLGTNAAVNTNNDTYIAYAFSEVDGFSKFGSYTGNGSADGPFVWCGFRPRYVFVKRADTANGWVVIDTQRSSSNIGKEQLTFESSVAADSTYDWMDIVSNGFKLRSALGGNNTSGGTYVFAAFAESPFKYARAR